MPIYVSNLELKNNAKETLFKTFAKKQNYETIFSDEEKQKLFDLPNNLFYGKVDENNNPVMLDINSLIAVTSKNNVVRLCDVAAKAFSDLQDYFATARQKISTKSNFVDLFAEKGHGSLNSQYLDYFQTLNKIFSGGISKETDKKITNIEAFFDVFVELAAAIIRFQNLPVTRTGFLMSSYCSPHVSGLVVDLYTGSSNDDDTKYNSFIKDNNFIFLLEAARRFNFKVDKDIPWRLVFSLTDSNLLETDPFDDCGAYREQGYFRQFGINSVSDFFNKRYLDTMIGSTYDETTELYSFKVVFLQMYNNYVVPNKYIISGHESLTDVSISAKTTNRSIATTEEMNSAIKEDRWLKLLLYLRALETRQKWNQTEFDNYYAKAMVTYKNYGLRPAIFFINKITRNILDLNKTSNRMIDRKTVINEKNSEAEFFRF
jgi:hypothetical protein